MSPDGIDQSWSVADPPQAKAAGVKVVSMYLSHDPSKNVTAEKVRAYHAVGIATMLNWESDTGRPLGGAPNGTADAGDAVSQVKALINAVGYQPHNVLAIAFSCDQDTTPSNYPQIDAYYRATKAVLGSAFHNGVYGEADLVEHLHSSGLTDFEWQTYAWSGGRLSPEADYYQYSNNQNIGGASVDFDHIIHAVQIGAWWPPGHQYDSSPGDAELNAAESKMLTHMQGQLNVMAEEVGKQLTPAVAAMRQQIHDLTAAVQALTAKK